MATTTRPLPTERTSAVLPTSPHLASSLLADEDLDALLDGANSILSSTGEKDDNAERTAHLTTGLKSLDAAALADGLESARVVEISGDAGAGVSEICRTLLVSYLLKSRAELTTAAVVDTTGNFDVLRLYALLVARLAREPPGVLASLRRAMDVDVEAGVEGLAAKVLGRVKIMRVFDFEGVREAVGEVEGEVEGRVREKEKGERDEVRVVAKEARKEEKPKRTFVADSEDEDDGKEEEMLFESENKGISAPDETSLPKQELSAPSDTPKHDTQAPSEKSTLKFILIDNLAHVLSPLLKNDMTQGTIQSSTLLSTLSHLTHAHALHTLLVTPITPRAPSPTRPVPDRPAHPNATTAFAEPMQHERDVPPPPPSIFSSNTAACMPALGALMGLYADIRLLVSRVPRRRVDAKVYYNGEGGAARKSRVEMLGVLEVVGDRWGGRTGAWGTFREGRDGICEV